MGYYNYHRVIKNRITNGEKFTVEIVEKYNGIAPCMLIIFNDKKYPIREYRWEEYIELIDQISGVNIKITK